MKRLLVLICVLLCWVTVRPQWNGYEVKSIATVPATTLSSGYYALYQNGHKGFAFLSESMLSVWGADFNLAKSRISSDAPGISAFADLDRDIATGPAPNDRRWYVFRITDKGNGTCTIQCADGTYVPEFGTRVKLVSSATPGVLEYTNHGGYFSFKSNGQALDGDDYSGSYANVSTLATWDYSVPDASGNSAWTLYPVEMERFGEAKRYKLKHVSSGRYLSLGSDYTETRVVNATTLQDRGTSFCISRSGEGYVFTKFGTTETLGCATGTWAGWNTTYNVATEWNIVDTDDGCVYITSSKGYLGPNSGATAAGEYVYTNQKLRDDVKWQIVESNDEVNVTYVYMNGDAEWFRETKTVAPGPYPELVIPNAGVKYTNVPVGRVTRDETVVINCEVSSAYPLIYSQNLDDAQWVYFSNFDNGGTAYFLNYNASTPKRLAIGQTTPSAASASAYKWAFVGNPITGYKVYNKAAGNSKILSSTNPSGDGNTGGNTYIHLEVETDDMAANGFNTHWNIVPSALGFYFVRQGEDVRANKRGSVLAYWTDGSDAGSRMFTVPVESMSPVTSLVTADGVAVDGSKKYNLVNRYTGNAVGTDGELLTCMRAGISSTQQWSLVSSGSGFQFRNTLNKYLTGGPTSDSFASKGSASDDATVMYLYAGENVDGVQYYYINDMSSVTTNSAALRHFLGDDGTTVRSRGARVGTRMQWYLQEAVPTESPETEPTVTYVGSIGSGSYYRLVSYTDQSMSMSESGGGVITTKTDRGNYSQVWQLTSGSSGYTLKNLLSGKYIGSAPDASAQWTTSGSGATFYTASSSMGGNTVFYFTTSRSGWLGGNPNPDSYDALHSAPHQGNKVVAWQGSADASKWMLERVDISSSDLSKVQELQSVVNADYTSRLSSFFGDYACSQLKADYASMGDDQLRSAMSDLPYALREEAVRVKNDRWSSNATWNYYEKDFRIHECEAYSDPYVWSDKLGLGYFSQITQPTGIHVKSGEVVYLLVNDNVADSDGHLYAEMVPGVSLTGSQFSLKRGYNAVVASDDCEVFITYNCTNTNKYLSNYPDIRIHIVGGTCNGTFDMNRGHNNNDWHWLSNNMFADTYLHLRSDYHVMNCYLDRVRNTTNMSGALKIWDFVFETEERLMTSQFGNGKYRPIMLVVDNTTNNPNWTSGRVSMPGMYGDGALNYNNLLYSGENGGAQWVIEHEEGHGHQGPINLSGTTEVSNNTLAQIVNHIWGVRTSRGQAQNVALDYFNNGIAWIDYARSMMNSEVTNPSWLSNSTWISNKWWYQLWLYFHLKGDDTFFPRWVEKLQSMNGGIKKTGSSSIARQSSSRTTTDLQGSTSTAGSWTSEYMRMALAACETAQTDLYEFFRMWGFFRYADEVKTTVNEDSRSDGIFRIGDYSTYYLRLPVRGNSVDENALAWCKEKMQSYKKKAPGVMFINDTGELTPIDDDAECLKYDPSLAGKSRQYADGGARMNEGGLGTYTHFGRDESDHLGFSRNGTTITISGTGVVGFKIYDGSGELVYVSNTTAFSVDSTIANGLAAGTYSLVASLGDDTDLLFCGPHTKYTTRDITGITETEGVKDGRADIYDLQGRRLNGLHRGVNIVNGAKIFVR